MKIQTGCLHLSVLVVAIYAGAVSAGAEDIVAELKTCAKMLEDDTRSHCYEAPGKRVIEADSSAIAPTNPVSSPAVDSEAAVGAGVAASASTAASSPSASEPKMEENMGGYQYADKPSDHPDNNINTRVTQCQQDMDKVWFFKFENGQAWKQVDRGRLNFKDCNFAVIVSKDGFGYKMQVEGEGRKIRISRRK